VVPGVTSAVAAAAYAGIPLTHRNATSTLALVTGHEDPQKGKSDIDWEALGRMGTLVFLMGVKNLPFIVNKLLEAGKERACPAALIRWGTTPRQETLTGTLGDIVTRAQDAGVRPPAIFVVGPVVALREKLAWFDRQPLFGKTVLVTRPQAQAEGLSRLLAAEGARVITLPTIEILPVEDYRYLDLALTNIQTYDWLIFTSANGVRFFLRRLWERGGDLRDLKGLKICCIGPATAKAVEARGIRVDLVPDSYISEGVAAALIARGMAGAQVLLPRAEIARDVIPQELTRAGADVDVVAVYRTRLLPHPPEQLLDIMLDLDVVTFTSPSTVAGFMAIWGERPWPERVRVACLGPVTGQAATRAGLDVHIEEDVFTIEALVAGIRAYFAPAGK
jgi:uroporphyrinogen III methyltransferase/synthase